MSGLDWRKARLDGKRSLSTTDENEYRDRDAAARWLERNVKKPKGRVPFVRVQKPRPVK